MKLASRIWPVLHTTEGLQQPIRTASKKAKVTESASDSTRNTAEGVIKQKKQRVKAKPQENEKVETKEAQPDAPRQKKQSTMTMSPTDFKPMDVEALLATFGWPYKLGHTSILTSCNGGGQSGASCVNKTGQNVSLFVHRDTGLSRCLRCGWSGFLHERVVHELVGKRRHALRFACTPSADDSKKIDDVPATPQIDDFISTKTEPISNEHSEAVQRVLESLDLERLNIDTLRHFGARIWRTQAVKTSNQNAGSVDCPNAAEVHQPIRIVLPLRNFNSSASKNFSQVTHFVCLDELVAIEETGERKPTVYSAQCDPTVASCETQSQDNRDQFGEPMPNQLSIQSLTSSVANHAIFASANFYSEFGSTTSAPSPSGDLVMCNNVLDAMVLYQECGVDTVALEVGRPMAVDLIFAIERYGTITFWLRESLVSISTNNAKTGANENKEAQSRADALRERTKRYQFVAAFDKLTKKVGLARCRAIREKHVRSYLRSANRFALAPQSMQQSDSASSRQPADAFQNGVSTAFGTPMRNPNEPRANTEEQQLVALANPYGLFIAGRNVLGVYHSCTRALADGSTQRGTSGDILTVGDLIDDVEQLFASRNSEPDGTRWTRFPSMNRLMKGFRPGELTLLSGVTGAGKTTFLAEYALDLALSGVTTLFGSFEVANAKLLKSNIQQFYGYGYRPGSGVANTNIPVEPGLQGSVASPSDFTYQSVSLRNVDVDERKRVYAAYQDRVPMYFLRLFGASDVRRVYEAIARAIYQYDVQHVVLDNLQFLLGAAFVSFSEKFIRQDQTIETFRHLATAQQVHVTVVVHPRKDDPETPLSLSSLFGTAKAAQDADNIMIVQTEAHRTDIPETSKRKYVQLLKNRYDGEVGRFYVEFDRNTLCHRDVAHFGSSRGAQTQPGFANFQPTEQEHFERPNGKFSRSGGSFRFAC